jgi:hypothetical protein
MAACRYVDFPGIGTIDLDAPELPGNDRELLEVVMERMFAGLMILETIGSVASVLRQYESAGGSAPPAMLEAAEGVLAESAAGAESAAVASTPLPTRADSCRSSSICSCRYGGRHGGECCRRGRALVTPSGRHRRGRGSHAGRARCDPSRARCPGGHDKGFLHGDPGG